MQVEKILIWELNKRKSHAQLHQFRYSMTIANSHRVAQSIKMQDLH